MRMNDWMIFYAFIGAALIAIVFLLDSLEKKKKQEQKQLLKEVLDSLNLTGINIVNRLKKPDDTVIVKSWQALDNYDDLKYLKEKDCLTLVKNTAASRKKIGNIVIAFLRQNDFMSRRQYGYVEEKLHSILKYTNGYQLEVIYITSAGNALGSKIIVISEARVRELETHPEYLMTKTEYNKLIKQHEKESLEAKKHKFYDKVNSIIDFANDSKEKLIVKDKKEELDKLIQQLFDRTINSIQKIKQIDSDEWYMLEKYIADIDRQIRRIDEEDRKINKYYTSFEFLMLKKACRLLTQSRKEFNEYIEAKAESISQLFGKRTVRNETHNEDIYNYVRAYKKSINPFIAEVSAAVFSSAENNPINYIVRYFYPDKNLYKEQIKKLKILIEELETLKEAKVIIDNYKKDFEQYIQNVPDYVLFYDEDGFYSRLGLTIIDEAILNVEYKFIYTSDGGMAQRSFTVPMNEENIIELIKRLENRLSLEALAKEQRAMMTAKLRSYIKERDNYTCRQCGNSNRDEPNLLLEVDHIIPIAKGGLTIEANLQTLCWKCNRSKGAKLI